MNDGASATGSDWNRCRVILYLPGIETFEERTDLNPTKENAAATRAAFLFGDAGMHGFNSNLSSAAQRVEGPMQRIGRHRNVTATGAGRGITLEPRSAALRPPRPQRADEPE